MGEPAPAMPGTFTYKDYATWPDGERWELIGGVAWSMSPAPSLGHQRIVARMHGALSEWLTGKPCEALLAPVDVVFPRAGEADGAAMDVVQPDILVVCDPTKLLSGQYVRGAPDLVVEILSPSTSKKDLHEKFELYEREGVREYWVVEPRAKWLQKFVLGADGRYGTPLVFETEGRLSERLSAAPSTVLEGFAFNLAGIFRE